MNDHYDYKVGSEPVGGFGNVQMFKQDPNTQRNPNIYGNQVLDTSVTNESQPILMEQS